jgi:hypothetical protein
MGDVGETLLDEGFGCVTGGQIVKLRPDFSVGGIVASGQLGLATTEREWIVTFDPTGRSGRKLHSAAECRRRIVFLVAQLFVTSALRVCFGAGL